MLLDKEIEVSLGGGNISYYKKLGYEIPFKTRGVKIKVKIEDVPKMSSAKVRCSCDYENCDKILFISYSDYNRRITKENHNGKYYCFKHSCKVLNGGENCNLWKSELTQEDRNKHRNYEEYNDFIKRTLARDGYKCQICNSKEKIEVHHLNGYGWYKNGRTDESNAITLCNKHHRNFHSIYGNGNNTKEQFIEWTNNFKLNLDKYNGEIPQKKWIYCIEDQEIIKNTKVGLSRTSLMACCNGTIPQIKCKHYIFYEDYLKMSKNDILLYVLDKINKSNYKPVICLNNNRIFTKICIANKWCNSTRVIMCCKGVQKHSGHNPITKEPLQWKYLHDYLIENNCTLDDYLKLYNKHTEIKDDI